MDYLDLRILQGELRERNNREYAEECYTEVLEHDFLGDPERSEIAARAYFRRAINRSGMGRKTYLTIRNSHRPCLVQYRRMRENRVLFWSIPIGRILSEAACLRCGLSHLPTIGETAAEAQNLMSVGKLTVGSPTLPNQALTGLDS